MFGAAKETPQAAVPTSLDVATLVSALTPDSDTDEALFRKCSTASKTPQAAVTTPLDVVTLAPVSDAANAQTALLAMPVASIEGEAGLLSDGFDRLGAVSGKTPQFIVQVATSNTDSVAAGNSRFLSVGSSQFSSGLLDLATLSRLFIHTTTNNYSNSNSNNHSNTTTISLRLKSPS